MNILYLTISYKKGDGSIYDDLIDCLIEHKHNITVVKANSEIDHTLVEKLGNQLSVLNVKCANQFNKNIFVKGINMLKLEPQFKLAIKKYLSDSRYDLILYATPPITFNGVVAYCKKKYNAKTYLMLKDIFPQNAVDLGFFKKDAIIHKFFKNKEKKLYSVSDKIGCMSKGNVEYLLKHTSLNKDKVEIFFNSKKFEREKIGDVESKTETIFVFGGNIGKPQNIVGILRIVDSLKNYKKARFVFIGKGSEEHIISEYANSNNKQVTYYPFLPQEKYENILLNCDVGLISLDARFTIPNIPSKLVTYLKYSKPVLAITDSNTDLKDMIFEGNFGWWYNATNAENIINGIKEICENKDEQIVKGKSGYEFFKRNFNVESNVEILENFIKENKI
ncbi:MAG: glycosyltransferase family 4 protein [Bacilli bacterium]